MDINSEKLKTLREEKFWSQDELAIAAGLSLRTIQRAEREGVASLQSIKAMASALNVDSIVIRGTKNVTRVAEEPDAGPSISESTSPPAEPTADSSPAPTKSTRFNRRRVMSISVVSILILASAFLAGYVYWNDTQELEDLTVTERPEDLPFGDRILGHWESSSSGALTTLDVDKKRIELRGDTTLRTKYSLLGNAISYNLEGHIVSARIVFESPTDMVWTHDGTGAVELYTRNKIVMPNPREVYASIKGTWYGNGDVQTLEVEPKKLKMTLRDGTSVESDYVIDGLRLSLSRAGSIQHYAVTFGPFDQMTWTKVFTAEGLTFVRNKP